MESYLVVKNSKGEKCVCSQITKNYEGYTTDLFYYNNPKRGETVVVDNYRIVNHIAGNLTEFNPLNCFYSVIGIPAIIVITLSIGDNNYNLFRIGDNYLSCDLNNWFEIGDQEKKIIDDYNKAYKRPPITCRHNAKDFSKMLFIGFSHLFTEEPEYCSVAGLPRTVRDEIVAAIKNVNVKLINQEKFETQLNLLKELTVKKSSIHRIKASGNRIEIKAPISWSGGHSIGHDFDGLYQTHYGYQDIACIEFDVAGLCEKYLEKIKKICKEQEIELTPIEVDDFGETYEFNGYVEQFEEIREEYKYDDYYEHNLQLPEW